MTDAATDAVSAITLYDEDIKTLSRQAAEENDKQQNVASNSSQYARCIHKITTGYQQRDGYLFNFKVYLTKEINAFAMADGTVRVNNGLMDIMNDEELLFILGHEMGHVVKDHSRKKVILAYASSALRKGFASQNNEIGQIASSVLGVFAEQLANAQFSQYEERQADIYGFNFLEQVGHNTNAAITAFGKLNVLVSQHTVLSSHPEPKARAEILK